MGDVRLWISDEVVLKNINDDDIDRALSGSGWSKDNKIYDDLHQSLKDLIEDSNYELLPLFTACKNVRIAVYPKNSSHWVCDYIDYRESEFKKKNVNSLIDTNAKSDRMLEKYVNSAVAKYFQGTTLLSNYRYVTMDDVEGEVDGVIVGKDEDGKNTIVFVETKRDLNTKYNDAKTQMLRTLNHWNQLKDAEEIPDLLSCTGTATKDIIKFKVKDYRDYNVRCAFGGEIMDDSIGGQLKIFRKFKPLKVVKSDDNNFQVKNLTR